MKRTIVNLHGLVTISDQEQYQILGRDGSILYIQDIFDAFLDVKVSVFLSHFPLRFDLSKKGQGSCKVVDGDCIHSYSSNFLWSFFSQGSLQRKEPDVYEIGEKSLDLKKCNLHYCKLILIPEISEVLKDLETNDLSGALEEASRAMEEIFLCLQKIKT